MRAHLPRLGLCAAFAAFGAVAGWFSDHLLSNPLIGVIPPGHALPTAACAALVGAVAGLLLGPSPPRQEWLAPQPTPMRVAAIVLATGALAGALLALLRAPVTSLKLTAIAGANGFFCAIPFIPFGIVMVSAVRHASQARRGSIVAHATGRAVLCVFTAAVGLTSAFALPDWPASARGLVSEPVGAALLTVASAVIVAGLVVADLFTIARIRRLRQQAWDMESRPAEDALLDAPRVDFGLGEQVVAEMAPIATYRAAERPVAVIVGSAGEALAALGRSLRWGVVGLALLEGVAIGHGLARGTDVDASYHAWLCDSGQLGSCREAAVLSERAGYPEEEAIRLHLVACDQGDERSCLAVDLLHRRRGPLW